MKALRIGLFGLLGLTVVAVVAAAIFVATFDANRYKPEIEQMVFERTGRVLNIEGNIDLTVLPNIGADLGRVTLSDKDPAQSFLTIDSASVSLALLPLLSDQVLIDGITIDGLTATVIRRKDGTFNFEDILNRVSGDVTTPTTPTTDTVGTEDTSAPSPLQLDIGSINLTNANLTYTDRQHGQDLKLNDLNLQTGQIAEAAQGALVLSTAMQSDAWALDAKLSASGEYALRLADRTVDLSAVTARLTGDWQTVKAIDSTIKLDLATNLATDTHTLSSFSGSFKADVDGEAIDVNAQAGKVVATESGFAVEPMQLTLNLTGQTRQVATTLTLPAFEFSQNQLTLKALTAKLSLNDATLRREPLLVSVQGDLSLNTDNEGLRTQLSGQFDNAPIQATVGLTGFTDPAITFDVTLDQLRLERFGGGVLTNADARKPGGSPSTAANSNAETSPDTAIDLSGLKGHNIKGQLLVKEVLTKSGSMTDVRAGVVLNQGRLSVSPHSASLFGGKLSGSLTADANNNQFQLKESITGIKLESLLVALGQVPRVTGQGSLSLDLSSTGQSIKVLERQLAGQASFDLRNGTVKGIDIAAILNNVRSILGKAPIQQGDASGQTTFTELTGSVDIQKGIATNQDLSMKAPLFRLLGNGTFNIPQSTLDYRAKVAVVETSTGQGGADLAALRGVTVPVRIQGTPKDLTYRVDVASLAADLAKSGLGDKAKEEINRVVPGLGDALKGLFGR
jgi:AsmA protein